jgi:hypothetical protein
MSAASEGSGSKSATDDQHDSKQAGITGGCGGGKYCPDSNVTRGQMAAFLRRAFQDQEPAPHCRSTGPQRASPCEAHGGSPTVCSGRSDPGLALSLPARVERARLTMAGP